MAQHTLMMSEKQIGRWLVKKGYEVIYPKNGTLIAKDPLTEEWLMMMDAVATTIAREENQ